MPNRVPQLITPAGYNSRAMCYYSMDEEQSALADINMCLKLEKSLTKPRPEDLAIYLDNAALIYLAILDFQNALNCQLEAAAIYEQLNKNSPKLGKAYSMMGESYFALGQIQKAIEIQKKGIAILKSTLGSEHPLLAEAYATIAITYSYTTEIKKALDYSKESVRIWELTLPPDHPDLARAYEALGGIYGQMQDFDTSLNYQLKGLSIISAKVSSDSPSLPPFYNSISATYLSMKDYKKSLEYLYKALPIDEKTYTKNQLGLSRRYYQIATVNRAAGDIANSTLWSEKWMKFIETNQVQKDSTFGITCGLLAMDYIRLKKYPEAIIYANKAIGYYKSTSTINNLMLGTSYGGLASCYYNSGDIVNTIIQLGKALPCYGLILASRLQIIK